MSSSGAIQIRSDVFQPDQLSQIVEALKQDGHRCVFCEGLAGIDAALSCPDTQLLLVGVADNETPQLIELIKSHSGSRDVPVLVYFSQSCAGEMHPEIDDFLSAPLNLRDLRLRVNRLVNRFAGSSLKHAEESVLSRVGENLFSDFATQQFIGSAPSFLATVEKIPRVASCDATVLIVGDTGTGKELCARAIHYLSGRAKKTFMPVNCGAIPAELFENELFGHEPGAFTDARQSKRGLISDTEGGTLFLDEVESLPHSAQVKLLRLLQERQYRPIGGNYRKADIRVVAATNQNLPALMKTGAFREDLFYRLKVITLNLPSLRDRKEDILPLATLFLKNAAEEYGRPVREFSASAKRKLMSYPWPGNVRELENVVRGAVALACGPIIRGHDLELTVRSSAHQPMVESLRESKAHLIEEFERTYLEETLVASNGNISKAARLAGKDRRSFFALLKKYNLALGPTAEPRSMSL
ncbi:MAG TPA: sigma-54 dependent transcriptional regulator [Pyrinomonadaceae bacterium]